VAVTVDATRAIRHVHRLEEKLSPQGLRIVGQKAAEILTESTKRAFQLSSDPVTGHRWKPRKYNRSWSHGTSGGRSVRRKVKKHKLLILSGNLRRGSIGKFTVNSHKLKILGVVRGTAGGKSPTEYARAHQEGIGVPMRRYMGMDIKSRLKLRAWVRRYLNSKDRN